MHYTRYQKTTTAMATRGWRSKIFHELNNGLAGVFYNYVRILVVLEKFLYHAENGTSMTNYSRFLTSNCRLHSPALLKGKSGTVGDNEDIEPLVKYLGEKKVNFESDVLPSCVAP